MSLGRRTWLRFGVWVAFLVAVAAVAGLTHLGVWPILGVMAAAWLLVALVELMVSRHAAPAATEPVDAAVFEHLRVVRREHEPVVEAEPVVEPEPEPVVVASEPEPAPPAPQPEPEPEPEPEPIPLALGEPQAWNLWTLEQLARDAAGADAVRDEERAFLLMYLRDFANPDGRLPPDFDALVRDSFGELLAGAPL